MNMIQEILTLTMTVLPLLSAFLTFLVKFVKNEKAKKALQQAVKLTEKLQPLIVEAERFSRYSGEEKKQYVLTRANQFAISEGVPFDAERVGALIDSLVETTKRVNGREKDLSGVADGAIGER